MLSIIDQYATYPCYEFLVVPSEEKPADYSPELATSWELAPDKSSYTLHLRQGVKFHDGTDFNADAAKWNLDRVIAAGDPSLKDVKSVDVIDNYTIRINLNSWNSVFLSNLSKWACTIISPTAFEQNGAEWAKTHIVGTGPFKQKEFVPKDHLTLEKFDDYWQPGLPYLDGIEVYGLIDPMTYTLSFKAGELDAICAVDMITAHELQNEGFTPVPDRTMYSMNFRFDSMTSTSPFADKRVRQALEYALDKTTILNAVTFGFDQPIYGILGSVVEGGHPKTTPRMYDPTKAKQLLADAGYAKGLKIKLLYQANEKDLPLAIQPYFDAAGFEVEMTPLETGAFYQKFMGEACVGNEVLLAYGSWTSSNPISQAASTFTDNPAQWLGVKRADGTVDLMKQVLAEEDSTKALALLEQIEELAYDDAQIVPLCSLPFLWVFNPRVKAEDGKLQTWLELNYTRLWLEK
jgi:ABC-type transport system substrate-binding protein